MDEQDVAPDQGLKVLAVVGVGCLIVMFLACIIGAYVLSQLEQWAVVAGRQALIQSVNDSELSQAQKDGIVLHVDRLGDAYESNEIGMKELGEVMKELSEGPLLPLLMLYAFYSECETNDELSAEEKKQAKRAFDRFCRGVVEKSIPRKKVEKLMEGLTEPNESGRRQRKRDITKEELLGFIASLKKHADDAEVPDEAYEVDIASEFGHAVDKAFKK